jgi:hypothetical protein
MITFNRLKEIIEEGKSVGDLHHYTDIGSGLDILRSNKLHPGYSTLPEKYRRTKRGKKEESQFISTTRDKNFHRGSFIKTTKNRYNRAGVPTEMSFVLNGDSISNKARVMPYNDFPSLYEQGKKHLESEQIIDRSINNIKDHIKEIRLHKPGMSPRAIEELKSHGIKVTEDYA